MVNRLNLPEGEGGVGQDDAEHHHAPPAQPVGHQAGGVKAGVLLTQGEDRGIHEAELGDAQVPDVEEEADAVGKPRPDEGGIEIIEPQVRLDWNHHADVGSSIR